MRRDQFPLPDLPAWCVLNNVTFSNVKAANIEGRGLGLVAEKDLSCEDDESPALLTIPNDLVLSDVGVEQYAKENRDFRELLNVAGHQSRRGDVLLFLLMQLALASPEYQGGHGITSAWTQYIKLLPSRVPVPTLWSQSELALLRGTSLEFAVSAKLSSLEREFNHIRDTTSELPLWNKLISIDELVTLEDWIVLDALYRSRSLALPRSGESMVPFLDLANHSSQATAYFEENSNDEVVLLLHKGTHVPKSHEVTIDYGHDKSIAEMLFSYGFIDFTSTTSAIVLSVELMDDDPLAKAKLHAYGSAPTMKIVDGGPPQWDAPFVQLMCLNHEDGLHFKIMRENDGSQHLRMFWQDTDVTEEAENIEPFIRGHKLYQIFRLRAVTIVLGLIQQQLDALDVYAESTTTGNERPEILEMASRLGVAEKDLLERTLPELEREKTLLLENESVMAYLAGMNDAQEDSLGDEDFS